MYSGHAEPHRDNRVLFPRLLPFNHDHLWAHDSTYLLGVTDLCVERLDTNAGPLLHWWTYTPMGRLHTMSL